jgi:hypothetical protein
VRKNFFMAWLEMRVCVCLASAPALLLKSYTNGSGAIPVTNRGEIGWILVTLVIRSEKKLQPQWQQSYWISSPQRSQF